jgi:hypothetical protein
LDIKKALAAIPPFVRFSFVRQEMEPDDPADEGDERLPKSVVAVLSFSQPAFGWGELTFVQDEKGQLYIDTERMSTKTVLDILHNMLDAAITDQDMDPEKHKRYNDVRGRRCGTHCEVCYPKDANTK